MSSVANDRTGGDEAHGTRAGGERASIGTHSAGDETAGGPGNQEGTGDEKAGGRGNQEGTGRHRRLRTTLKESMRELSVQLSLLNAQVSSRLELKESDLYCLDVVTRHGPISPTALARRTGLHPATMTGILDRLERGGWISRERDPSDRRAVLVRPLRDRGAEIFRLYGGMNAAMDGICARYGDAELELVTDFLRRTVDAGHAATADLAAS